MYFDATTGDSYWGRLICDETLVSFLFTVIYLIVRFESSMCKVDRLIKGIAMSFTIVACTFLSNGSGAIFNPAIGFAQSIYMIGVKSNPAPSPLDSNFYAKYMWIYMLFPYAGASLAALFFKLH